MRIEEIRLVEGRLELVGPPAGTVLRRYNSSLAGRMLRLRVAEANLSRARMTLDESCAYRESLLISEASAAYVASLYFSCFQSGDLSPMLDARQVFKGMPEALERHNDWLKIRNERFNHPGEVGRAFVGGIAFDQRGSFVDYYAISMDTPIGQLHDWLQLLYQLICRAQEYVSSAAEKTFNAIKAEVANLRNV